MISCSSCKERGSFG
uniref:Uncharacterized protein n=1 Tax=Lepeophtheirus salmonis TaxID=72036 RepID=A0A0K2URW8_LEPSM